MQGFEECGAYQGKRWLREAITQKFIEWHLNEAVERGSPSEDHPEAYDTGPHSETKEVKELPGERGMREGAYVRSLLSLGTYHSKALFINR